LNDIDWNLFERIVGWQLTYYPDSEIDTERILRLTENGAFFATPPCPNCYESTQISYPVADAFNSHVYENEVIAILRPGIAIHCKCGWAGESGKHPLTTH
jgi:hypothetical protein